MITQRQEPSDLADLLRLHRPEIAALWAEKVHNLPGSRYSRRPLPELHALALEGVAAMVENLATGSRQALETYLEGVSRAVRHARKDNIFAVKKDVSHLNEMCHAMDSASDLAIVGCGLIGVEIAEECQRRRKDVNIRIVEMLRHCLQLVYDKEFCVRAEETLKGESVELLLDEKVDAFLGNGRVSGVRLASGNEVKADLVIMGIGAAANTELAIRAGLEIGPGRGIQVDRYIQTSDGSIFACGDCADKVSFFDGKPSGLKLASIATMEARIAGANLYGPRRVNMGVIGVYSPLLGDTAFAAAGRTEALAMEKGYRIVVGEAEAVNRHPGCMPGAETIKVKLIFEAGNRVRLGGQVTGARSGGELINAISACIHQRMTADDIATSQTGTHPALTASPIAYQLVNAAEMAIAASWKQSGRQSSH